MFACLTALMAYAMHSWRKKERPVTGSYDVDVLKQRCISFPFCFQNEQIDYLGISERNNCNSY